MIGTSVDDPTFPAKVAGIFPFMSDVRIEGALHAAVVRSPYPRARLIGVDVPRLRARPGVVAVFTAADVPSTRYNPAAAPSSAHLSRTADKRLLTDEPRHVGDGVAVVVADTREAARAAVLDPPVTWEPRPGILDLDAARSVLCEVRFEAGVRPGAGPAPAILVEQELSLAPAQHVCMEPHACAAVPGEDGVVVWTNGQSPGEVRRLVAEILAYPVERITVRKLGEGGGFGAKQELYEEALVTWIALRLGRPVRLTYTRTEEFTSTRTRHGGRLRLRAGFSTDGLLVVSDLHARLDAGAYASHTPYVLSCVGGHLPSVYPRALHRFTGVALLTNNVPAGAYRGYGVSQAATLCEQVIEEAAGLLGRSAVQLRIANLAPDASGERLRRCLLQLDSTPAAGPGAGHAVAVKSSVTDPAEDVTAVRLTVDAAGAALYTGTCDSGTGSSTALAQIVGTELGMTDIARIDVVEGDSARVMADLGSSAQRSVHVGGTVARRAALAARDVLLVRAAATLGVAADDLKLTWPTVRSRTRPSARIEVAELCAARHGGRVEVTIQGGPAEPGNSAVAVRVSTDVDPRTGFVAVRSCDVVVDCGTVVNPRSARGQVLGAVAQGIGLALHDRIDADVMSIQQHGVPRAADVPATRVTYVDGGAGDRPSGIGELVIVAVPAAVVNAFAAATGTRPARLPLRPEVVAETVREA